MRDAWRAASSGDCTDLAPTTRLNRTAGEQQPGAPPLITAVSLRGITHSVAPLRFALCSAQLSSERCGCAGCLGMEEEGGGDGTKSAHSRGRDHDEGMARTGARPLQTENALSLKRRKAGVGRRQQSL